MQFIDLNKQYQVIKNEVDAAVLEAMESGRFIMGPQVVSLEKRLAEYVGKKHCISCSNGTDALTMALMAMNVGEGDAVFTTDFTFFATAETIAMRGATPVFVEIDPVTFNIDPQDLIQKIEQVKKEGKLVPKAISAVDLFGLPADYEKLEQIAKNYGLLLLEDGAQGFGGTQNGRRVCSFGDIATTSFFPAKPLGCYGDGGAVFTDDDGTAAYLKSIRVHGHGEDKYDNVRLGLNARLDTVQAAVLHCKLDVFDKELISRQKAAARYTELLRDIPQVITPKIPQNCTSSYAQYTLMLPDRQTRDRVKEKMAEQGVPTFVYYSKPMHLQTAFHDLGYQVGDFPKSEKACGCVLSLPMHPYLEEEEIQKVCQALKAAL